MIIRFVAQSRVQNDHSKPPGFVGVGSRWRSRSIPPKRPPKAASSDPILMRVRGETASSKITRISASVLRALRAARNLSARWTFSGRLRTVTAGMGSPLSNMLSMIAYCYHQRQAFIAHCQRALRAKIVFSLAHAKVAELADAPDLGTV